MAGNEIIIILLDDNKYYMNIIINCTLQFDLLCFLSDVNLLVVVQHKLSTIILPPPIAMGH